MRKLPLYGILILVACIAFGGTAQAQAPYTALGDSYSAGEGNHPFDGKCHRASDGDGAYPRILPTLVEYVSVPNFHACTGAVTADVWLRPQPKRPGQRTQIEYVRPSDMLVTLTLGGNDLHFAEILRKCLSPFNCTNSPLARQIEAELPAIGPKLVGVYTRIRAEMDARGYLVVGGYPELFELGPRAGCNPLISPTESAWINGLVKRGNAKIAAAARTARETSANVFYVSPVDRFAGHGRCAQEPWLHGLTVSAHEGRNPFQGSYHPTRAGQLAYAEAFEAFLRRPGVQARLTACPNPQSAC
jgi:GDSL-like Lipase/Acylhydrolase family